MENNAGYITKILSCLNSDDQLAWCELHKKCFKSSSRDAVKLFQKYELNDSRFAFVYYKNRLVAAYSGLFLKNSLNCKIFLSTDTMSDKTLSGGSIIAAHAMYSHLRNEGVKVVCGYPNKNIEGLRTEKLGWVYSQKIDLYVMPAFCLPKYVEPTFRLNRPTGGFFRKTYWFLALGSWRRKYSLIRIALSSYAPHPLAINLSLLFRIGQKKLFFKYLAEGRSLNGFKDGNLVLNSDSIDVP